MALFKCHGPLCSSKQAELHSYDSGAAPSSQANAGGILFPENVSFSVRARYSIAGGTYVRWGTLDTKSAHHYLTLNSLGRPNLTPAQIMSIMKEDWDKVFPWSAQGSSGTNKVFAGQIFRLPGPAIFRKDVVISGPFGTQMSFNLPTIKMGNYVKVTETTPTTVTVQTMQQHILTGQVENGVFTDSTGEAWLYQKGTGFDKIGQRVLNYSAAPFLWFDMAANVRKLIDLSNSKTSDFHGSGGSSGGGGSNSKW